MAGLTVTGLHLYPVKSCRAVDVQRATVGPYGLVGDRHWQVQAPDGAVLTQRQFPALTQVQPEAVPGGLRLVHTGMADLEVAQPQQVDTEGMTFSGPVPVADAGDEAAAWFAAVLGAPCRLVAIAEGYRRRVVIGEDVFGQEVSLADAAPLLVANAASYRQLAEHASEPFGIERFRPNVVIDGCDAWAEDTWRRLAVGATEVRVVLPWPRCAVPQIDQHSGERHREPAAVLKRFRWCSDCAGLPEAARAMVEGNAVFGVGAAIGPVGAAISVGDAVAVVESGEAVPGTPGA